MPQLTLFVQTQADGRVVEVVVAENIKESELHDALSGAGVKISPEIFVFIDESEDHVSREGHSLVMGIKHGARVHVTRCRRIKTTVHFLDKTIEEAFPPGSRVRSVKKWAAHEFHLDHK